MPDSSTRPRISKPLWAGVIGLILITIVLVAYSAMTLRDVAVLVEKETPTPKVPEIPQPKSPDFVDEESAPGSKTSFVPADAAPPPQPKPTSHDMEYALPVPGNPLVVVLPGENGKLGQISIEKYDSDGNPTGLPLPQHTQVQIPDPNNPGEKIYFKVP